MPYFLMTWGELPGSKAGPFCRDSRYAISPAVYRIFARDYSNLTSAHVIRSNRAPCPGGGIGRRAGFRCQWLNGREGSSPFLGTILVFTPFITECFASHISEALAVGAHTCLAPTPFLLCESPGPILQFGDYEAEGNPNRANRAGRDDGAPR